ncbi:LysR family transcriptional regulator [Piscinibacter sp.]|uniref:LysR family transcriptional regulator n=1 Tax=Piscinibacter sp. TaxID=1903157 RepID=UPI002BE98091|nr:LysR family transcriptional regulator [Albitalea sp.]HUG24647.1 LysR family transcriptional regulator [Albitalea sp.]
MLTFKQLEAVYWIVRLGGFSQAAQKLHTTQSAVSKRIQEIEALLQHPLFDRSQRSARLTGTGEEVFVMAEHLLAEREDHMRRLLKGEAQERHLRIGVTEVTAMTWLPRFVDRIHGQHPKVIIDPEVDSGVRLRDKLLASEIDLMIAADTFRDDRFKVTPVGKLRLQWMCRPGVVPQGRRPFKVQLLQSYRILTQGPQSGTGVLFQDWFKSHGLTSADLVVSNSLVALIGLTVSGFGISYLPPAAVQPMVDQGLLEVLDVKPALPDAAYAAAIRRDQSSSLMSSIVQLAKETCDFSRLYQVAASGRPRKGRAG